MKHKLQIKQTLFLIVLFILMLGTQSVFATDIKQGKKLYDKGCNGCHDTRIHTRPNRIIHTYEDLIDRVKFCDNTAKTGFTEPQMMDVVDYLNDKFYKFIKE